MSARPTAYPSLTLRIMLRQRLLALSALLLLMSAVLVATMEVHAQLVARLDQAQQVITTVDDLLLALVDIETGERGFLLTGQEPFLSSYDKGLSDYGVQHTALVQLLAGHEEQRVAFDAVDVAVQRWLAEVIRPAITLRREVTTGRAQMDDVLAFVSSGIGKRQFDAIRAQIGHLRVMEREAEIAARTSASIATAIFRFTLISGTLLLLLMLVGGSRALLRGVLGRLDQIASMTRRFAEDPRAPLAPLPTADDEIGQLGATFVQMALTIQEQLARQQATEQALRESEARAHTLIAALTEGVILQDQDGAIQLWNDSAERVLGLSADELPGRTSVDPRWQAIHIDGSPFPGEAHPAMVVLRTGEPQQDVVMGVHKPDGSLTWLSINSRPLIRPGESRPSGAVTSFFDITDAKHATAALQASEAAIRALYEVAVHRGLGLQETLQAMLGLGCQHFGLPMGLISNVQRDGFNVRAAHGPGEAVVSRTSLPLADTYCSRTMQSPVPIGFAQAHGSAWQLHPCYARFGTEAYLGTVVHVHGEVYGTLCFMGPEPLPRDFSEADKDFLRLMAEWVGAALEREAEATVLEEAMVAADAANRAKSAFLAMMSHEIRTPLNAIIGLTDLLLGDNLPARAREHTELVQRSGNVLLATINDILDFSKIEAERLELEQQPIDLVKLITEAVDLVAPGAQAKQLTLHAVITSKVPPAILGDPTRLRQILINLLANAVKFTPQGEVVVEVTGAEAQGGQHLLTIAVRDTGVGIPTHQFGRLFQPFTQADASTTRRYHGTGLGLAISRRLAELMGGTLTAVSEEGQGSTFTLTLPVTAVPLAARTEREDAEGYSDHVEAKPRAGLRILVAEDNPVNQLVAKRLLESLGYEADLVGNGREVCAALAQQPYDVVLMDMEMPIMDGIAATRLIRETAEHGPQPWVIALTAHALSGTREQVLAAGMNDYLSKPVRAEELAVALARVPSPAEQDEQLLTVELEDEPAVALLDQQVISMLVRSLGPRGGGLLGDIVQLYQRAAPLQLANIQAALETGDWRTFSAEAHLLRGSSASLGAVVVQNLCATLQGVDHAADLETYRTLVKELAAQLPATCAALGKLYTVAA